MENQNKIFARMDEQIADLLQSRGIKSAGAAIVYAVIKGFTESGGGCYFGTLATLSKLSFSTKATVLRHLADLEKAGLIQKSFIVQAGKPRPAYTSIQVQNGYENDTEYKNETGYKNYTLYKNNTEEGIKIIPSGYKNYTEEVLKLYPNRIEQNITENKTEEGGASAPAHTRGEELPDIVERAMQPYGGHEVPTIEEVEAALRNMTVRPREDKISLCAGYFLDKMDKEQWRTRDWRGALMRYAARWVQRDNTVPHRPEKKQAPFCRPGEKYEDSGECPW